MKYSFLLIFILTALIGCRNEIEDQGVVEPQLYFPPNNLTKVTRPTAYDQITKGSRFSITWDLPLDEEFVKITLFNEREQVYIIKEATRNDGNFKWQTPSSLESSYKYKIKVEGLSNDTIFGYSTFFAVL
jgi:hypothetical protein